MKNKNIVYSIKILLNNMEIEDQLKLQIHDLLNKTLN